MAIPILNHLDLRNVSELQNAIVHKTTSASASTAAGKIIFDTGDNLLKFYDGSAWKSAAGDITAVSIVADDSNSVAVSTGDYNLTIAGGTGLTSSVNGTVLTVALDDTNVSPGSFGSASNVATFTVDQQGRITAANNVAISVSNTISDGTTNTTLSTGGTLTIQGTDNEVEVVNANNTLTLGLPDDVNIAGNVVISGDLTVQGDNVILNTETLTVDDNIIVLNNNVTAAPTENAGIEVERGTSDNVSIRWNESTDRWQFTNDGTNYNNIATTADSEYKTSFPSTATTAGSTITITHSLNTRDVVVQFYANVADIDGDGTDEVTQYEELMFATTRATADTVTIAPNIALAANAVRVLVKSL